MYIASLRKRVRITMGQGTPRRAASCLENKATLLQYHLRSNTTRQRTNTSLTRSSRNRSFRSQAEQQACLLMCSFAPQCSLNDHRRLEDRRWSKYVKRVWANLDGWREAWVDVLSRAAPLWGWTKDKINTIVWGSR